MITFCSGPAIRAEKLEEVFAHLRRSEFDEQLVVEVLAGVLGFGQVALGQRQPGPDVADAGL
jgi:hypothetical protein